ncbi:MAG TPA: hypothetical protein VEG61_00585 [Candidatus Dormibacteraeota bacterium]|nr:hypothetical protein [Candidatus Dormibacteraeota bacterium]
MKPIYLVLLGSIVLVSGDAFDSATTAIALLNPVFAGEFFEASDPFIRLFMYDLGLAKTGFIIGLILSLSLDVVLIYAAYSQSRSYTMSSFGTIVLFMTFLGLGHWAAGYSNLLQSYAPSGFPLW